MTEDRPLNQELPHATASTPRAPALWRLLSTAAIVGIFAAKQPWKQAILPELYPAVAQRLQALGQGNWGAEELSIERYARLDQSGCRYYGLQHRDRTQGPGYAMIRLPDKDMVLASSRWAEDDAAARVLSACGQNAPARWWAQILSAFSPEVPGVWVGSNGKAYVPPQHAIPEGVLDDPMLESAAGVRRLRFYSYTGDYQLYQVTATLSAAGELRIQAEQTSRFW